MKSIKTKLALFVSCLCVVLILLVWFLTVGLFEPNYTRMIRSELNDQISAITEVMGDKTSGELTTDELRQIVSEARGLVQPGVCVDVSDASTLEPVFIVEKIGDSCQLHPAVGMFNDKQHDWNSGTVLYVRGRVAQDGSVNLILPDQQGQQQQVVGQLMTAQQTEQVGAAALLNCLLQHLAAQQVAGQSARHWKELLPALQV